MDKQFSRQVGMSKLVLEECLTYQSLYQARCKPCLVKHAVISGASSQHLELTLIVTF